MDDNASDSSEQSVFLGSLGIYVPEGTWESDLRVELDLQLGREEWETSITGIEGGESSYPLISTWWLPFLKPSSIFF